MAKSLGINEFVFDTDGARQVALLIAVEFGGLLQCMNFIIYWN